MDRSRVLSIVQVVAVTAAAAGIVGVGVWLVRGGAGTSSTETLLTASGEPLEGTDGGTSGGGARGLPAARAPIIGAFDERVARRLASSRPATAPITAALVLRVRDAVWLQAGGREFARAAHLEGRLATGPAARRDVVLTDVTVNDARVTLIESPGGGWNYEQVLARLLADEEDAAGPERVARIERLSIVDAHIDVRMQDQVFSLEDLDARVSAIAFSGPNVDVPRIVAETASAVLVQPAEERRVALSAADGVVRILEESVAFEVRRATIDGARIADAAGEWNPDFPFYGLDARGTAVAVELADMRQFLPERAPAGTATFTWSITPVSAAESEIALRDLRFESDGSLVTGSLSLRADSARMRLWDTNLQLSPVSVALLGTVVDSLPFTGTVTGSIRGSAGLVTFELTGDIRPTGAESPFAADLTGSVRMTDAGVVVQEVAADLRNVPLESLRSFIPGLPVAGAVSGTIRLTGPPSRAPLSVDVVLTVASGTVTLAGTLDVTGPHPVYDLRGSVAGVDLSRLGAIPLPPVLVHGAMVLTGAGVRPDSADARLSVNGGFTGWRALPGDTAVLAVRLQRGTLVIDTLAARLAAASVSAAGQWRFAEPAGGAIRDAAAVESLAAWGPYIPLVGDSTAAGTARLAGEVSGTMSSPAVEGELAAEGLQSGGWTAARLEARYAVRLGTDVPEGSVTLTATDLGTPTAGTYPQVSASITHTRPSLALDITARRSDGGAIDVEAIGRVPPTGPRDLVLQRAEVDLVQRRWSLAAPASFRWGGGDGFAVENFEMHEERGAGLVRVQGRVLPLADANFEVETAAFPLGDVQELFGMRPVASGELTTVTRVLGPGSSPTIDMEFRLENGMIDRVSVGLLEGTMDYTAGSLQATANGSLGEGTFQLNASVPAIVDLEAERRFAIVDSGAVSGFFVAEGVSIAPLGTLTPQLQRLTGRLHGRVDLTGTVAEPAFAGSLVLAGGSVRVPALNQDFTELAGEIELSGRTLLVHGVRARSDGYAILTGNVTFQDLTSPVSELALDFDNFRAVGVEAQEDAALFGRVEVRGPWDGLIVSGTTRVEDGYVPIPQFGSDLDAAFADLPAVGAPGAEAGARARNPLMTGLTLQDLRIQVGAGVWFTAEAARAQLAGELVVNRSGDALRIQGTLQGERGVYTLQAGPIIRRFDILSAEVRFLGTPEPNPAVDIVARRIVFDPSGRQIEVEVRIGGTLRTPTLSLASADAPAFPESELLSILFFGRPTLELGGGGIPGETVIEGTFVGGLAELATLELEEALIRDLGLSLDIFQVRFGPGGLGGFGAPTFVFGWELGQNFFLTAESGIAALMEEGDAARQTWALRFEWAFDPNSRLSIGREPVAPSRYLRGLGIALPITLQQQFSLELRRRWSY
jgi:hypothetical protein